jgi:hypothetical protein
MCGHWVLAQRLGTGRAGPGSARPPPPRAAGSRRPTACAAGRRAPLPRAPACGARPRPVIARPSLARCRPRTGKAAGRADSACSASRHRLRPPVAAQSPVIVTRFRAVFPLRAGSARPAPPAPVAPLAFRSRRRRGQPATTRARAQGALGRATRRARPLADAAPASDAPALRFQGAAPRRVKPLPSPGLRRRVPCGPSDDAVRWATRSRRSRIHSAFVLTPFSPPAVAAVPTRPAPPPASSGRGFTRRSRPDSQ